MPNTSPLRIPILSTSQPLVRPSDYSLHQQATSFSREDNIRRVEIQKTEEPLLRTFTVPVPVGILPQDYCRSLKKNYPTIEYAAPIESHTLFYTPNDPLLSQQDVLSAWNMQQVWDITQGDSSVLIGINDSGVEQTHEDIVEKISRNLGEIPNNSLDDDNNGYIDDYAGYTMTWFNDGIRPDNTTPSNYHGHSVAGVAAAATNNGKGMAGIAPKNKIVPIKTVQGTNDNVVYGYEGILYGVARGVKVMNCSWGRCGQIPNLIEQSIIDYATARDVAIVVAAGNVQSGCSPTSTYFPAAYNNVLSVGETNVNGVVASTSTYGIHAKVFAPSSSVMTTTQSNGYGVKSGTSFASPLVAGVVALVRSKYPALTAEQSLEHVRVTSVDISSQNSSIAKAITRSVSPLRALQIAPGLLPSLRPNTVVIRPTNTVVRPRIGDTLEISISWKNILAPCRDVRIVASLVSINNPTETVPLEWVDNTATRALIGSSEEFITDEYRVILSESTVRMTLALRLEINGTASDATTPFSDVRLLPFLPQADFTTIRNRNALLSIGDYGWIGTNIGSNSPVNKGEGFGSILLGNKIYSGGILAVDAERRRVRSGVSSDSRLEQFNDFVPVSVLESPYKLVLTDIQGIDEDKVGIEITTEVSFPDDTSSSAMIALQLKNKNAFALSNPSLGMFIDWDITPTGDSTRVALAPDFVPNGMVGAGEILTHTSNNTVVGAVVVVPENSTPQAAGFVNNSPKNPTENIAALVSGTSIQSNDIGDASMIIGSRSENDLQPNDSMRCVVCLGVAQTRSELTEILQKCAVRSVVSVENTNADVRTSKNLSLIISPLPASDIITLRTTSADAGGMGNLRYRIASVVGQDVGQGNVSLDTPTTIDVSNLAPGIYALYVWGANTLLFDQSFVVLR